MSESSPAPTGRSDASKGIIGGLSAYGLWGLFPLFWPLVEPAGAVEILGHRIVWSLLAALVLSAVLRIRWWHAIRDRRAFALLGVASVVIAVNWGTYIWAVTNGRVVEAALGYYINPILSILAGVVALRERLSVAQWVAVGIAFAAVITLTIEYGRLPWVALTLATSFATYGIIKKTVRVPAISSLTIESTFLLLPALGYLIWQSSQGGGTFARLGLSHDLLLITTGVVSVGPLLLFAYAAPKIPLSTMGLLQYVAPTIQFLLGVLYFHEVMSGGRWAGFALVWLALVIITVDGLRRIRRRSHGVSPPN